jgi:mannose-6-phosphate isomerase-like protein (cupin superfamily)
VQHRQEDVMQKPYIHQLQSGDTISAAGATMTFKLRSEATAGRYSLTEYLLPPQFAGPPPHVHHVFEHTFYVVEGYIQVQLDGEVIEAAVGTSVFIPAGVAHTFANPHPQPSRILAIDTPGGLERYYEELAAAFPPGTPLNRDVVRQIQARYDTHPPA